MSLLLDFYPFEALAYACARWHYAGRPAAGRQIAIGATEDSVFIGALSFGRGACKDLATRFKFSQTEAVEFTRCALASPPQRRTATTRIVRIALQLLKKANPGLQVVISFSDPMQRGPSGQPHAGGIYVAGNWMFLGFTHAESLVRIGGELRHPRSVGSRYGTRAIPWLREHVDAAAERVITPAKYRFAYPLTDEARERLRPFVQPYPKCGGSRDSAAPELLPGEDRANRISPLSHSSGAAHG